MITAIGLALDYSVTILNISLTSLAIAIIYVIGMQLMSNKLNSRVAKDDAPSTNFKQITVKFILFSSIIFISGSALALSGDAMAKNTGISATAIGSILVALSSSIPDAMSVFTALKLANINLAIGAILGSNLFNILVIAIADVFYSGGSIWLDTSNKLMYMSFTGFFLTVMVMVVIKRDHTRNTFTYILPS
ncbi:hypothetical protein ACFQ3N_18000 [Virgibacillus byunsanensis]|uniref:Sodium/calcium exchanger membrane region domain-containing protein n=1 Tax=Virgibacillus byunsanensis TaxID=570945 RepID=A0ABW3LTP4_9BACI